jgi:hypothetical protein
MGNVIAMVPASGGVGASALAAAVAVRAAAAGRSAVAVDLDRCSGRLDIAFGVERADGWRWPDLADAAGVVDGAGLAAELPRSCGVSVLSGLGMSGWGPAAGLGGDPWLDTVPDVITGLADAHDLTVLDLARDVGVIASVALLVDAVVVVVGSRDEQLAAAAVVVPGIRGVLGGVRGLYGTGPQWDSEPLLPIEPWVVLRGDRVQPELPDLIMDELDVPLTGVVGEDRWLVADVVEGLPPGARGRGDVVRAADELLLRLVQQELAA